MTAFLASAHLVDLVLAIVGLEVVVIVLYWHRTHRGITPAQLLPNLLAGALLLLALRLALSDYTWPWYTVCLAAAGIANVTDLRQRWR
jgi:hypothetical protein